jgi:hypothetical protein
MDVAEEIVHVAVKKQTKSRDNTRECGKAKCKYGIVYLAQLKAVITQSKSVINAVVSWLHFTHLFQVDLP